MLMPFFLDTSFTSLLKPDFSSNLLYPGKPDRQKLQIEEELITNKNHFFVSLKNILVLLLALLAGISIGRLLTVLASLQTLMRVEQFLIFFEKTFGQRHLLKIRIC